MIVLTRLVNKKGTSQPEISLALQDMEAGRGLSLPGMFGVSCGGLAESRSFIGAHVKHILKHIYQTISSL